MRNFVIITLLMLNIISCYANKKLKIYFYLNSNIKINRFKIKNLFSEEKFFEFLFLNRFLIALRSFNL